MAAALKTLLPHTPIGLNLSSVREYTNAVIRATKHVQGKSFKNYAINLLEQYFDLDTKKKKKSLNNPGRSIYVIKIALIICEEELNCDDRKF